MRPLNKGHFGMALCVLCKEVVLFEMFKMYVLELLGGNILLPQAVSFVERFVILCLYFGESTIRGSEL